MSLISLFLSDLPDLSDSPLTRVGTCNVTQPPLSPHPLQVTIVYAQTAWRDQVQEAYGEFDLISSAGLSDLSDLSDLPGISDLSVPF